MGGGVGKVLEKKKTTSEEEEEGVEGRVVLVWSCSFTMMSSEGRCS